VVYDVISKGKSQFFATLVNVCDDPGNIIWVVVIAYKESSVRVKRCSIYWVTFRVYVAWDMFSKESGGFLYKYKISICFSRF